MTDHTKDEEFEQWYVENAFDYVSNPIGSRDCGLQRAAWKAGNSEAQERIKTLEAELAKMKGGCPAAWRIELEDSQWFTDDLDEACDDLTNHDAKAIPLFEGVAAIPEGMVLVPKEPTEAMLRPFYGCQPDELGLAFEAMLQISAHQQRVAAAQGTTEKGEGDASNHRGRDNQSVSERIRRTVARRKTVSVAP